MLWILSNSKACKFVLCYIVPVVCVSEVSFVKAEKVV